MASVSWPYGLCYILRRDFGRSVEQNVRRTEMEDGAISQAKTASRDFKIRRFTVLVKESNKDAFDQWLSTNSNVWFDFTDVNGETKEFRLRGGSASVELVEVEGERLEGERYSRGEVQVEGY